MNKITKEERETFVKKRLDKVENDLKYKRELFKTYFGEKDLRLNLNLWKGFNQNKKIKIIKQINKLEDKNLLEIALRIHKLNFIAAKKYVQEFKDTQLKEFGVREK